MIRALCPLALLWLFQALPASSDTIAYYRFEKGEPGRTYGSNRSIIDSSGHGYDLSPFSSPAAASDVPTAVIPRTGEPNRESILFTGAEDIFVPEGNGLGRVAFTNFTIEAWVRFDTLVGWQTIIGRDDTGDPGEGATASSLFYLSKTTDTRPRPGQQPNALRVELITRENQVLTFESPFQIAARVWYHIAVVGDARDGTLSIYVNGSQIGGTSGFTGLFSPTGYAPWTLGRGQYRGRSSDRFFGNIDEVRFSDQALSPSQFLNAKPPRR